MSLPECPYHCDSHYLVYNPQDGAEVPCPYCTPILREQTEAGISFQGGSIKEEYHITTSSFDWNNIVPDYTKSHLDQEKAIDVRNTIEQVLMTLQDVNGKLDKSYVFGITEKGDVDTLAGPLITLSLKSGKKTAPLITATLLNQALVQEDFDTLQEYYSADTVVVQLDQGCSKQSIWSLKSLLQNRALYSRATIIITTWDITPTQSLLAAYNEADYAQAEPHFMVYKNTNQRHSWYVRGILGMSTQDNYGDESNSEGSTSVKFGSL